MLNEVCLIRHLFAEIQYTYIVVYKEPISLSNNTDLKKKKKKKSKNEAFERIFYFTPSANSYSQINVESRHYIIIVENLDELNA